MKQPNIPETHELRSFAVPVAREHRLDGKEVRAQLLLPKDGVVDEIQMVFDGIFSELESINTLAEHFPSVAFGTQTPWHKVNPDKRALEAVSNEHGLAAADFIDNHYGRSLTIHAAGRSLSAKTILSNADRFGTTVAANPAKLDSEVFGPEGHRFWKVLARLGEGALQPGTFHWPTTREGLATFGPHFLQSKRQIEAGLSVPDALDAYVGAAYDKRLRGYKAYVALGERDKLIRPGEIKPRLAEAMDLPPDAPLDESTEPVGYIALPNSAHWPLATKRGLEDAAVIVDHLRKVA